MRAVVAIPWTDTGHDITSKTHSQNMVVCGILNECNERPPKVMAFIGDTSTLEKPLDLEDVSLGDLVEAVRHALDVRPPIPSVAKVVAPLTVTVAEKMALIEERLERHRRVSFNHLLAQAASRLEIIITFLAVLELIKLNGIEVQQERLFGEIVILGKPPNQAQRQKGPQGVEADIGQSTGAAGDEGLVEFV